MSNKNKFDLTFTKKNPNEGGDEKVAIHMFDMSDITWSPENLTVEEIIEKHMGPVTKSKKYGDEELSSWYLDDVYLRMVKSVVEGEAHNYTFEIRGDITKIQDNVDIITMVYCLWICLNHAKYETSSSSLLHLVRLKNEK